MNEVGPRCYLCHERMEVGSQNYFDASGIATHLVCPRDDPSGKKLDKAMATKLYNRRHAIGME